MGSRRASGCEHARAELLVARLMVVVVSVLALAACGDGAGPLREGQEFSDVVARPIDDELCAGGHVIRVGDHSWTTGGPTGDSNALTEGIEFRGDLRIVRGADEALDPRIDGDGSMALFTSGESHAIFHGERSMCV